MPAKEIFFIMTVAALLATAGNAAADGVQDRRQERDQEQPSMELLEFLGQWETETGVWVDPAELEQMVLPEQEQQHHAK